MAARRVSHWTFTLNNPTEDELIKFRTVLDSPSVVYGVFGQEVGENGTPHLQGFFILPASQRLSFVRRLLSDRAHFEPARASAEVNRAYCIKDGLYVEFGRIPDNAGTRTDLIAIVAELGELATTRGRALTSPEVARANPVAYIRYPRLVRALTYSAPVVQLRTGDPRPWQLALERELCADPIDDRCIVFYVDLVGNTGKSWFIDYFLTKYPDETQLMTVGRANDLSYDLDSTKHTILVDVTRGGMQYLSYRLLEQIKGRRVFSTKYGSAWKYYAKNTHVVVFCNEDPNMTALSEDRYILRYVPT